ncbi:MAG: hypothetical protein H6Q66_612 [Firmicutes bacterium]|nr:hypothetical protein [Bacillota bacterium]
MNVNLNMLPNSDLVDLVERELERYNEQQGHSEVGYGLLDMRKFQVYYQQLGRCLYGSKRAVEVHARVKALLDSIITMQVKNVF